MRASLWGNAKRNPHLFLFVVMVVFYAVLAIELLVKFIVVRASLCKIFIFAVKQNYLIMLTKQQPIADILSTRPELILVLERLNIYPGVQDKTIKQVAVEQNINPDLLLLLLQMQLTPEQIPSVNLPVDDIKIIIHYLSVSHDYYTSELYPVISDGIKQLAKENKHPSMQMVEQFFVEYRKEADNHFEYENNIAFPYILALYEENRVLPKEISDEYSVDTYRENHDNIEEKLDDLKQLLIKYLPDVGNIRIRRDIILTLDKLDTDLKAHAKIEDEVLIPLVRQLEEKVSMR